jgi:hypothetical protein
MSGGAQINYTLHFNENFSLVFGAAVKYCQNTYGFARLDESSVYKLHVSSETDTFLFNANIWNYTETYSALYVQIPILFSYETDHPLIKWYINAGLAAQFTVYSKYRTKISPLTTYGYSTYNKSRIDSIPRFGFGTVPNMKVDGKPTLKFTLNGYIETGIKVSIGRGKWLYIGVFGEMSILKNSVAKVEGSGSEYVINYAPNSNSIELTDQFNVTSITNTKYTSGGRTYAFGGVVRIGFDFRTANRMLSSPYRRRR